MMSSRHLRTIYERHIRWIVSFARVHLFACVCTPKVSKQAVIFEKLAFNIRTGKQWIQSICIESNVVGLTAFAPDLLNNKSHTHKNAHTPANSSTY